MHNCINYGNIVTIIKIFCQQCYSYANYGNNVTIIKIYCQQCHNYINYVNNVTNIKIYCQRYSQNEQCHNIDTMSASLKF